LNRQEIPHEEVHEAPDYWFIQRSSLLMKQEGSSDLLPSCPSTTLQRNDIMALDLLDAPLRMTWDLCPAGQAKMPTEKILACGDALVDAGLFSLILEEHPLLFPALDSLLDLLQQAGIQTALVVGGFPAEGMRLARLKRRFPLLVDAAPWLKVPQGLQALSRQLEQLLEADWPLSLLWVPARGHLKLLPALVELCRRLKLPRLKLPNHKRNMRAEASVAPDLLGPEDLFALQEQLKKKPLPLGITSLEVHDLFLWELLFPQGGGQRSEYGGCQAGNSIGHLTAAGEVWPCSSWPQVLGHLPAENLLDIWTSDSRLHVRDEINTPPRDCQECQIFSHCFGGCRGLARSCSGGMQRRDPLCPGPRTRKLV